MRPGEQQLREAIAKQRLRVRTTDPQPYDKSWGWWVDARLHRLEQGQLWLVRIGVAAFLAQVIRLLCEAIGIL